MIMRITWGKLRPGSWNEFERTYNATVAVKGRTVKGLRGRWLPQNAANKDTGFAVSCAVGSCGVPRLSLAGYVPGRDPSTGTGPKPGAPAAGGRSCCLSSRARAILLDWR
jgi:hypothetical protein